MTEKLYYLDAYIREFSASVLSVERVDSGYDVILDKTAFFPEEGGQSADSGYIGDSRVISVYEKDGVVHHITDTAPTENTPFCKLDFAKRLEKMQCHTAEHILSGIIHKRYGFDNVGFHLGDDVVTFDVSGYLTREDIELIEREANEAVFANIIVETFFPSARELPALAYRAKLDITEGVRIVRIGEIDTCACCAPHVGRTGEIGLIKILDFMKHRGGTRITMVAGRRALSEFSILLSNIKRISALLSEPPHTTADILEKYIRDSEATALRLKHTRTRLAASYAEAFTPTAAASVAVLDDLSIDELRDFCNAAMKRTDSLIVAISGKDGDYRYVIASSEEISRDMARDINTALSGKGGGRGNMIQGSFATSLEKIKEYFEK